MPAYSLIPVPGTDGGPPVPSNRILLLEGIAESGAIGQAAKAAGMSYRSAWTALDELNALSRTPLVTTVVGGKGGGGAQLTQAGRNLVTVYRAMEQLQRKLLRELAPLDDAALSLDMLRKMMLKTSARNQLHGLVREIHAGTSNDEIVLALAGGEVVSAIITRESTELLELQVGSPVVALIKAPWVKLKAGHEAQAMPGYSSLPGLVDSTIGGPGHGEVVVQLPSGVLIVAAVEEAGQWWTGQAVTAQVEAANVILGVAH
ncbi:TOBE domain-containing protein [Chitinimonas naiadis]